MKMQYDFLSDQKLQTKTINSVKYASFKYDESANLGDQIQTLAAEQFLPRVDRKINRDSLKYFEADEPHLVLMNGWFAQFPEGCLPASHSIIPVFLGFHMTSNPKARQVFLSPECIDYFKRQEPIGCRDRKTAELLASAGVETFYSKCLTLTFPRREETPENGKVFVVDAFDIPIPASLRKGACFISHSVHDFYGDELKTAIAQKMLEFYKQEARLVITTKLHCAMPCIAMGIPVVFFGNPEEYRVSILQDLGLKINPLPSNLTRNMYKVYSKVSNYTSERTFLSNVNWNPEALDIEQEKQSLIQKAQELISKKLAQQER